KAGSLGRRNTHSPQAQARRSETQRRQNAWLQAWSPKEKPDWLDKTFYEKQILPRLRGVSISQIKNALSVSEPYALCIRAGRPTSHPRHWLNLSRLLV